MDTPSQSVDVQRPPSGDAFDVLRLVARYDLDSKLLAERHRTLSLALHPDRFAGRPSAERRLALDQAMQVNSAYRALKDPLTRAELLARRHDVSLDASPAPSPEFLEHTMERREALAEAVLSGDRARVAELARLGQGEKDALMARLAAFFSAIESGDASAHFSQPGAAESLGEMLSGLRFLQRFIESAEAELEAQST